jgi:L-iditol 2-dehydrogenase
MENFTSAWVTELHHITYKNQSLPEIGSQDVLVKVKACGICGTDIHYFKEFPDGKSTPLGHEVAGMVEYTGDEVRNVKVGDPVVVQNHVPCGVCEACLNQRHDACEAIRTYMEDQAGIGGYLMVPSRMVIPFKGLGFAEATLAEPITVSLDLCREASVRLLDDVLIMGPGTIGLGCIPIVKRQGARHIVVAGHDLDSIRGQHRREIALSLGATDVVDTADPEWKISLEQQYPSLFDRVIITSPPHTITDGIDLAGFRGWIVYDGISYLDDTISFGANDFHFKKKRLIASHAIPNWGFPQALDLLRDGTIPPHRLLTHTYPFEKLAQALYDYGSKEMKVIKIAIEM